MAKKTKKEKEEARVLRLAARLTLLNEQQWKDPRNWRQREIEQIRKQLKKRGLIDE